MSPPPYHIAPAGPADLADVAMLFRTYAASIGIDLGYQNFEAELAGLPGKYAPPVGALLIARDHAGKPLGCVALRPLDDRAAEMKRLFVLPAGRGTGLGRALAEAIVGEARRLGYAEIRLDTLATMTTALALYASLGFEPIPAYYETPIAGTVFLSKRL